MKKVGGVLTLKFGRCPAESKIIIRYHYTLVIICALHKHIGSSWVTGSTNKLRGRNSQDLTSHHRWCVGLRVLTWSSEISRAYKRWRTMDVAMSMGIYGDGAWAGGDKGWLMENADEPDGRDSKS